jgi:GMP reductase
MGSSDSDLEKVKKVLLECPRIEMICLDVANGYTQSFVDAVVRVRESFPSKIIMAGMCS